MMATSDDENNNKCPLIKILSNHSLLWFQRMQQEGRLCDATLKTDDGASFPVHRIIMGSCSPYFKALFTTTLHPVERKEFTIPGISGNALGTIIRFAYGGQVDITNDNAMDLIVDADQFAVMRLVEECCRFIMSNINCDNCVTIRAFAANYLFKELEDAAHRYLMRNFPEVVNHSRELLQLPMEELCSVLSSDELNIRNEHVLWELLLRWIENDPEKKKPHVCKVMQHIRWGLVESQYFVEKVKIHPLLQDKEECRSLVINILKSMYDLGTLNNQETGFPTPTFARPRMPHDILFAIGGWSGGNATSVMESYDTRADRWIQVENEEPMGPRAYHGCVVINYDIYIIGGFDGTEYFNSCIKFNAETKKWKEIAPMHCRRCYVSVTVLDGVIYAMGGYDGQHRLNSVETYNYRTNQWSFISPMFVQRSDANATTLDGKVYIVGGFNGQQCVNSAEFYDPSTREWTLIANMRSHRSGVSCTAYNEFVYAIGGFNGVSRLRSVEKYNPETNVWSAVPDMHSCRSNFAVSVIDGKILAIGGYNGITTIHGVESFDDQTNSWEEVYDLILYRSALSSCVVSDLPNYRDYIFRDRDQLAEERRQRIMTRLRNPQLDRIRRT